MGIIERSIRQPVAVTVAVLLLVIFGVIGLVQLPVQLTPDVDQPVVSVTTRWFGASPQEVEQEIIREQEDVLKTVSGLREMRATAVEGEAKLELQFYVGVNKDVALNEVRDKLRRVPEYPTEVDEPVVESVDSSVDNYMAWMIVRPKGGMGASTRPALARANDPTIARGHEYIGDVTELQTFLEERVKPMLDTVEGVAEVNVLGGREREMQVRVDLDKLAARGIPIDQLTSRLRGENLDVTAGTVVEGKREVSVRAVGRYERPEQVLDTIIAYAESGAPVYVRDVAEADIGFKRQVAFVRSRGQDVVAINAKREVGTNILNVMNGLKAAVNRVNAEMLEPKGWGLEVFQVYDQTIYVNESKDAAGWDLLIGAALAAAVLFLTLRSFGATAIVALSMPISIIGTFLGMYLTGRNLNVISLAGLAFAIGMGVDNTIVVLENIFRHREMGKDRYQAALDGTREVWGAIVAATLANIAVFLPVAFIAEEAGQLFRDISIAISISLFLYMVVSPTVIPMMATVFLRKMPAGLKESAEDKAREAAIRRGDDLAAAAGNGNGNGDGPAGQATPAAGGQARLGRLAAPVQQWQSSLSGRFYNAIMWLTAGVARRLVLVCGMILAATIGSWLLMPPRNYLPSGNENLVFSILTSPPGYSVEEFKATGAHVEAQLSPWWEADPSTKEGAEKLAALQQQWRFGIDNFALPGMQQGLDQMKAMMPPDKFEQESAFLRQMMEQMRTAPPPAGIEEFFFVAFNGRAFIGATSRDPNRVPSLALLMNQSVQGVPGTFGFAMQKPLFNLGAIGGVTVDVNVTGLDYEKVRAAAGMLQGAAMAKFGTRVNSDPMDFTLGRAETQVLPDRARAAAAGVSTPAIREAVQVAVDGAIVGDYRDRGDNIDFTVVSRDRRAGTTSDLADVPMAARTGVTTPQGTATTPGMVTTLGGVATFVDTSAPQQVNRLEREPSIRLSIPLPANMTIDQATAVLNDSIIAPMRQGGMIPPEVNTKLTGSADKLDVFMGQFIWGFALAAVITYLLLAALFESFLHPFVIIMSVPFALVGGFVGLRILHTFQPAALLDVLTMLGFVILIGTIVNNPILIVHQALNYIRGGMDRRRAIALSTQTRVRPIFMSVTTSVAGMLPLVVFGGAGSELYRGLGAVVVGGLLVSTFFTLFLTPALMSLMLDAQAWVTGRGDEPVRAEGPPELDDSRGTALPTSAK